MGIDKMLGIVYNVSFTLFKELVMELIRNREGFLVGETHRECTGCGQIFQITSKMTLCKECNSSRVKSLSPEWRMHNRAKVRASQNNVAFDIEIGDIQIPDICPILGIPLIRTGYGYGKGYGPRDCSPSLDRIDNSRGYEKDNIQVISQLANRMKSSASIEQLQLFAKWINEKFPATD